MVDEHRYVLCQFILYFDICPVSLPHVLYINQKKIYAAPKASNILSWGSKFVHIALGLFAPSLESGVGEVDPPRDCPWPGNVPEDVASCFTAFCSPSLSAPLIVRTCLFPLRNMNVGMAATLYAAATSFAVSTSHFRKLTSGNCFARASNVGAIIWQGPHHFAWKSMTVNLSPSLESIPFK